MGVLRLGFVNIAVQSVLGDAEELAYPVAALGDEEGSGLIEKLHRLDLILLVHQGHWLTHHLHALLDQLIQQVRDIPGNRLRLLLVLFSCGKLL